MAAGLALFLMTLVINFVASSVVARVPLRGGERLMTALYEHPPTASPWDLTGPIAGTSASAAAQPTPATLLPTAGDRR